MSCQTCRSCIEHFALNLFQLTIQLVRGGQSRSSSVIGEYEWMEHCIRGKEVARYSNDVYNNTGEQMTPKMRRETVRHLFGQQEVHRQPCAQKIIYSLALKPQRISRGPFNVLLLHLILTLGVFCPHSKHRYNPTLMRSLPHIKRWF